MFKILFIILVYRVDNYKCLMLTMLCCTYYQHTDLQDGFTYRDTRLHKDV